jgi:DNA-binding transcriptional LysR family regulator
MKTSTDELLVFVTVIDSGSITAAAEKLQQTVSGVSRALTRLEKKLDTTLIRRTTRRLQLTEEGVLFLGRRGRAVGRPAARAAQRTAARGCGVALHAPLHRAAYEGVFGAVSRDPAGADQQ